MNVNTVQLPKHSTSVKFKQTRAITDCNEYTPYPHFVTEDKTSLP